MSQIVGHLFQCPSSLPRSVREIVTQIMKGEISDEFPFLFVCLPFEGAEPMVNAIFCETWTALGGENIGTRSIASTMLDIYS